MKTLVTTAADETEPEEVREAAREAVEAIDRGAPVRNGYDRVKEMRRSVETSTVEPERKRANDPTERSEEHTSELQSLMRISYAVFCLNKKKRTNNTKNKDTRQ